MRKCISLLGFAILILGCTLILAPRAEAYETYHDPSQDGTGYCATCHPGFVGRGALHDLHQGSSAFTNACNLCHTGNTRNNPFTMWSIGTGTQDTEYGCAGCHGRDYSETIIADYENGTDTFPLQGLPKMSTYGLRRFHQLQGVTECISCHGDVLPWPEGPDDGTAPITQPPYYQSGGGTSTNITGTCNLDGSEDGTGEPNGEDSFGLDNDGDGLYDTDDDDCPSPCTSDTDCDDGVSCTDDVCNIETGECSNTANDDNCADGEFCNGDETCDAVDDCQPGTPVDCDDGVGCTTDSCNEGTDSCDNVPDDGLCADGEFCNGDETCDAVDDCQPGTPPCDPDTEICDEDLDICEPIGCTTDAECDDGTFCNGAETCNVSTGECVPGTPPDCDDGVGCTVDSCNAGTDSCDNVPDDAACDNGQFCDGDETCDPALDCQAGTPPCDPNTEICDEDLDICEPIGCTTDTDCDDGVFCNGAETCNVSTGECVPGTPVDCNDGVGCTVDSCNEGTDSCDNVPDDAACDNGQFCDGAEICDPALDCQPGTPPDCDDGVGCTVDSCNEGTDSCDNVPDDAACDNGQFCDGDETCDAVDDCQPGTPPCDPNTEICDEDTDICEPLGCTTDADCDDGMFCNGAETCDLSTGECVPGTPVDCDDGVGCTLDSCNEDTDSCDNVPDDAACDDGQFCDGAEICDPALDCQPGTPPDCDDGVGCTVDSCNEGTDSCDNVPDDGLCADGEFCNGDETCDPALDCQPGTPPCDPATEICDEDQDICEPVVGGVDLDIFKFQVSRRVLVANPDPPGQVVKIKLWVYNAGEVDEPRAATVVGMQDTTVVYSETMMVSDMIDGEPSLYKFPSYDPERVGTIYWTATIADDDPDVDEATGMTLARRGSSRGRASVIRR